MGAGLVPYFIVEFSCSIYIRVEGWNNRVGEDKETRRSIYNLCTRVRFPLKISGLIRV